MTSQPLEQLLSGLDTLEFDIGKLINLGPTLPAFLLDAKMTELAESVNTIPREHSQLVTEWNKRLVDLAKKRTEGICDQDVVIKKETPKISNSVASSFRQCEDTLFPTNGNSSELIKVTSAEIDCERTLSLQRELHNLESAISRMFMLIPLPTSSLGPKLALLAEQIERIPSQYIHLVDEWNERMASLMQKYKSAMGSHKNSLPVVTSKPDDNSAAAFESETLERELKNIESAIMQLITMAQPPIHELDGKIVQLMEAIANIPSQFVHLSEWNEKAANLMEKYSAVCIATSNVTSSSLMPPISPESHTSMPSSPPKNTIPVSLPTLGANLESLERLVDQLDGLESDILRMLSMDTVEQKLEGKLGLLIELVGKIPREYVELTEKWAKKANALKEKYTKFVAMFPAIGGSPRLNSPPNSCLSPGGDSLRQELDTLEESILKMLEMRPRPLDILEQKIAHLMTSVMAIPAELASLTAQWSDKIGPLMAKYAEVEQTPSADSSGPNGGLSSSIERSSSMEELRQFLDIDDNTGRSVEAIASCLCRESSSSGDESSHCDDNDDPALRPKKEAIKSKIEATFRRFRPIQSETDFRSFRLFLRVCSKARRLIDSFTGNRDELYASAFSLVFGKFPLEVQRKFGDKFSLDTGDLSQQMLKHQNPLTLLIVFLLDMLANVARMANMGEKDELSYLFKCSFCKVEGHTSNRCAIIKAMFCFNCFNFGHHSDRCCNDTFPVDLNTLM